MVKVLENQIIDLDLFPGKEQQELKKRIQEHIDRTGQNTTASLPPEDRKQLEEAQRKASTQAANAASGVAGTLGGAVKGVLDTAGNTVGTLGGGVGNTVLGVTGGLADAAYQAGGAIKTATGVKGSDKAGAAAAPSAPSPGDDTSAPPIDKTPAASSDSVASKKTPVDALP